MRGLYLRTSVGCLLLVTCCLAWAQSTDILTVTFTVAAAPPGSLSAAAIPISPWTLALIAMAVAWVAYRVLRQRRGTTTWLVASALAIGGGLIQGDVVSEVHAAVPTTLNLITSPATLNISSAGTTDVIVVNTTGQVATITGRSINNSAFVFFTPASSPECTVGLILQPGASCFLSFNVS